MRRVVLLSLLVFSFVLFGRPAMAQEPERTIEIHAHRFAFEPASITVHRGETVRLRVITEDVPHSLMIEPLGINIAASKSHPGEAVFTAVKAGDFVGRCGRFCGSGHGNMKFVLHVTGD
jgi:cytochrome c oxidase subunit 2